MASNAPADVDADPAAGAVLVSSVEDGRASVGAGSPGVAQRWSKSSALLGMRQSIVLIDEIYNGGEAPVKGRNRKSDSLLVPLRTVRSHLA